MLLAQLSAIDLGIVVAYVLGTTLLGAWFARRQRDLKTYFVGDRDVSWWLVLASIVATETSTVTFLSAPGLAFNPDGGNLTFLQLTLGYLVGRVVIAWVLLPQYLRGELFSAYQLLRQRFDASVQRAASGLFLGTRTVADGLRLFLTGLLLHQFTEWDVEVAIVVMGVLTVAYTYLGGMQAVIWTDLIQLVVYLLGALVAAFFIVAQMPGGWGDFVAVGAAADKFVLFDLSTDLTRPYTLWAGLIGGAFVSMASHGADQIMVQRYLCSRSLGQARTALVLSGGVVMAQFLLFLLIGVGLYVLYAQGTLDLDMSRPRIRDEVFGIFIVNHLPVGLVGLVIAAVLAAAMSTLSSSLNSSSSAFVADFYRPLRAGRDEAHYLRVSKLMTLFWGLAQIAVAVTAYRLSRERSIIDQVLAVAGMTTGMVLGLFLLGSLRRPVASRAALAGLVVGFLAVLSVWRQTLVAWPWYAPIGTLVTVGVALLLDRLGIGHGPPRDRGAQPGLDEPR
jgi:SSS family transporter